MMLPTRHFHYLQGNSDAGRAQALLSARTNAAVVFTLLASLLMGSTFSVVEAYRYAIIFD